MFRFRAGRRTQHAGARRARRIRSGQLRTDARHSCANTLERTIVAAVLVPRGELLADALERAAIALVKRVGSRIELSDDFERGFFDTRRILWREVDHGVDVARPPLQAGGVAF